MVDPVTVVGIVATIVQLVDFGGKVISRLGEYQSETRKLPDGFARIAEQLPLLLMILDQSKDSFKALSDNVVKVLEPQIKGCQEQVERLQVILDSVAIGSSDKKIERLAKGVRSLGKDADVCKIDEKIQAYVVRLTFLLYMGVLQSESAQPSAAS